MDGVARRRSPSYRRCCHANRCRAAETIPELASVSALSLPGSEALLGGPASVERFRLRSQASKQALPCGQMLPAVGAAPYGRPRTYRRLPHLQLLLRREDHHRMMEQKN